MESSQLSRTEALACSSCSHACHVMLYSDTKSQLFGKIPIRHIILMQMRFDGLLGFPGGFVNPSKETLEEGLSRELSEELGVALSMSEEAHVLSCYAPTSSSSSSRLITHFYVKKMAEEQIREVERAAASIATDHGQECLVGWKKVSLELFVAWRLEDLRQEVVVFRVGVLGMVRVPLYTTKGGGGLGSFLSHSFIGNARSQLINSLLFFNLVAPEELHKALKHSLKMHTHTAGDLKAGLALTEGKRTRL